MDVETTSGVPFIIASLRTSWTDKELRDWRSSARKNLTPLKLTPEQKKRGVDLYSLKVTKRNGWKMNPDGSFALNSKGNRIRNYDVIQRNRKWNYDLIIYVDNGIPTSSGHGDGARPTYAQLFEQFLQPDGWIMVNKRSISHIAPLAPAYGYHINDALREELANDFMAEIEDIAAGTSRFRSVYEALQSIGASIVDHARVILEGGAAPMYSRPLSESTVKKWRPWRGVSGDKPMVETGEMMSHIHWKIVGWEKSDKYYGYKDINSFSSETAFSKGYNPTTHSHSFAMDWEKSLGYRHNPFLTGSYGIARIVHRLFGAGSLAQDIKSHRKQIDDFKKLVGALRRKVILTKDAEAISILNGMAQNGSINSNGTVIEPQNYYGSVGEW